TGGCFMSRRFWRRWGPSLLAAGLAASAMMAAEAGTAAAPSRTITASHHAPRGPLRHHSTRRRGGRRLPPGGVVWATHAIVLDPSTDEVLYEKNSGASTPCASLTKLMT